MLIGVPEEIKDHEYRVGLTPDSVNEVILHGHEVIVQSGAGAGIGAEDADYAAVGAGIVDGAPEVFERAEMIVKVKEPLAAERAMLRATLEFTGGSKQQAAQVLGWGRNTIARKCKHL